jgi:molybdate transport system substrate-binding protein
VRSGTLQVGGLGNEAEGDVSGPDTRRRLSLYAAGSLQAAMTDIVRQCESKHGVAAELTFGPSHLLRERIEAGEGVHVFASADMRHPTALCEAERAGPPAIFARTELCALVRADAPVGTETLVEYLLESETRLGVGPPGGDPLGNYTTMMFDRAEAARPGSREALTQRSRLLFGGGERMLDVPPGENPITHCLIDTAQVDAIILYRANADGIAEKTPGVRAVRLPEELVIPAVFGLCVVSREWKASLLAMFILSPAGQDILGRHGYIVEKTT